MKTRTKFLIGALAVVLAAAGGGLYWFFHDDAPAKVSLNEAATSLGTTTTAAGGASTTPAGIDGTWTVDTKTGSFTYTKATGTFVGFRIAEQLASIGSTTAVGRTGDVTGTATISGTRLTAASFKVDLTTITTNQTQRNQRVQQALETDRFPTATFVLATPVDLGTGAATGSAVQVDAVGDLTIHGVTKRVTFPLQAKLVNGEAVIVGSIDVVFSDYGVQVPQSQIVLSVADHGTLELQLLLKRS